MISVQLDHRRKVVLSLDKELTRIASDSSKQQINRKEVQESTENLRN